MARDWQDLFIVDGARKPDPAPDPAAEAEEQRMGRFRRLRENLRKTRQALTSEIQATLFDETLSGATWERLEEALIYADVGARTTAQVVAQLEREAMEGLHGGEALTKRLTELMADIARTGDDRIRLTAKPTVI